MELLNSFNYYILYVVADLVMEDVESRALSTYPQTPKFWKQYVETPVVPSKLAT